VDIGPDGKGRIEAISALLDEAEAAHGTYETNVLGGVYDQDWAAWYATWAIEHGIGELVGRPVTAARLAAVLTGSFEAFKAADPAPTEPWAEWAAGRIAADSATTEANRPSGGSTPGASR
jgi:hypothetical protein